MSEKQEVAFGYGTCAHCGHSTWPDSDEELDAGMSLFMVSMVHVTLVVLIMRCIDHVIIF